MEIVPYPDVELNTIFDSSLEDLELDDLIELCTTDEKYQEACTNQIFVENYEEKHFTITKNLILELVKQPRQLLQWIKNYSRWYLLTRDIRDNGYFISLDEDVIVNTDNANGILGVFANDQSLNLVKEWMIPAYSTPSHSAHDDRYRSKIFGYSVESLNLDMFPSAADILSILSIIDKDRDLIADYANKSNAQILVDIQLDGVERSNLLYGLFSFILRYDLYDSPQFIFMYVMFYYYTNFGVMKSGRGSMFFGDIVAMSYGFEIQKPIKQKKPLSEELPDTFDEFRMMFTQMYAQSNTPLSLGIKFCIYMYQLSNGDLNLNGYLLLAEDGGNLLDLFGTKIFNEFVDLYRDTTSDLYDLMIAENQDPITWLMNYRKQEEYRQQYKELSFAEPLHTYSERKVSRFSLFNAIERRESKLPKISMFLKYCKIMLLLTGWYTITY